MPNYWLSEVLDLTQMVMVIQKKLQTNVFIIYYYFCYYNIVKSHSLGHTLEMPYSWLSEVLDLTQMIMDIWKQLKITVLIILF